MTKLTRRFILCLALALLAPAPMLAVDGVLEINQTCAVNPGCFDGDTAGFPVSIVSGGSYRLTSSLEAGSSDGLLVTGSSVAVDLNGFEIAGDKIGISIRGANVGVRNGTVYGSLLAVSVINAKSARLIDLSLRGNRGVEFSGTFAETHLIDGCAIHGTQYGVLNFTDLIVTIRRTVIENATSAGIRLSGTGTRGLLESNVIRGNTPDVELLSGAQIVELSANYCGTNTTCP